MKCLILFLILTTVKPAHANSCVIPDTIKHFAKDSIIISDLQEIVIKASRPSVYMRADKTTYIPSEMISGGQSNLQEAIRSIPGVRIDDKGNILLNGIERATIYLDGRKTILNGEEILSYLRATPSRSIEKIEIINSPGAKADGSDSMSIINLVRNRNKETGYTAGINLDGQIGKAKQFYGSLMGEYNRNSHNISLIYSTYLARNPSILSTDRPYPDTSLRLLQSYKRFRKDNLQQLSLSYDYRPTKQLTFGTSLNCNFHQRKEFAIMTTNFPLVSDPTITSNDAKFITDNIYGGIFMKRDLSSPDSHWTVAFDFFINKNPEYQNMEDNTGMSVIGNMCGKTYGMVGSFDWHKSISPNWSLSAGSRISYLNINSTGLYSDSKSINIDDNYSETLDSSFEYRENVNAFYIESDLKFGTLNTKIGMRIENSNLTTLFSGNETAENHNLSRHYFNLYPSAALMLNTNNANSWMITYSKRVTRPQFSDLDPFIHLFDDITHIGGNINLKESSSHCLGIAWSDNKHMRISFNGIKTTDEIVKNYRNLSDKIVYVSPENIPEHHQLILSTSYNNLKIIPAWTISAIFNVIYSDYRFNKSTGLKPNFLFTPIAEIVNQIFIPKGITGELKISYQAPLVYGQAKITNVWNSYLGIKKSLFNGKINISLYIKDLFNTNHFNTHIYISGAKAMLYEKEFEDMRKIGLSFSFNFSGGMKQEKRDKRNTWIDELNRINL